MGWTTGHRSKDEIYQMFDFAGCGYEIIDKHPSAAGDWLILKKNGKLTIHILRIDRRGQDWGEGGCWPESCGPHESGCPVAWFDRVPAPAEPEYDAERVAWAAKFRARIRAEHETSKQAAAARRTLRPGQTIKLATPLKFNNGETLDTFRVATYRNRMAFQANGMFYRIPKIGTRQFEIIG